MQASARRRQRLVALALGVSVAVSAGCAAPHDDLTTADQVPFEVYRLCDKASSHDEFARFFDGNLVVVAAFDQEGYSGAEIAGSLVLSIVGNGLDFNDLSSYRPEFDAGRYRLTNGASHLGFSLYFVDAFGPYAAGDPIPFNVFDPSSFVTDVRVAVDVGKYPPISYSYKPGPLYDLVDGEVAISGGSVDALDIRVRIHADRVAFEVDSQSTIAGQEPRADDRLTVRMKTLRAPLDEVYAQFLSGGYGFSYDGTRYDSAYYGIDQTLSGSAFLMKKDETGWFWTGKYDASVTKGDATFYQEGFVSNREQNTTAYFCAPTHADRVGVAWHRLDLLGGRFVFEDGAVIGYGLGAY